MSNAGDVNGDGFGDILVSTSFSRGESYVIFGKSSGFDDVDLNTVALDGTAGFKIHSANSGDQSGHSISSAGDVNGDGFNDIIIGMPYSSIGGEQSGETYVIFGKSSGFSDLDLDSFFLMAQMVLKSLENGHQAGQ